MTAIAAKVFQEYHERYGTTRGAAFKAQRINGRHNGRVLIQAKPADLAKIQLPPAPNVEKLLCHIWNIPEQQATSPAEMSRPPAKDIKIDRSKPELLPFNRTQIAEQSDFVPAIPQTDSPNGDRKTK